MEIKLAFKIAIINSWTAWEKKENKNIQAETFKIIF